MDYYEIGQRIRKYRKLHRLSQEQLAEAVGISLTHMSHIETGNTKLSLPVLVKIADTLSVQADTLIHDEIPPSRTALTDEIVTLLQSCSSHDLDILLDVLRAVKLSLDKHSLS